MGAPIPTGIVRQSMTKIASWRGVPIHSALVRHGCIDFLRDQERAGFLVLNHADLSRDGGNSGDIDLTNVNWEQRRPRGH